MALDQTAVIIIPSLFVTEETTIYRQPENLTPGMSIVLGMFFLLQRGTVRNLVEEMFFFLYYSAEISTETLLLSADNTNNTTYNTILYEVNP